MRDSQNEIDNSQYTAHNIIDWVNINISDTSKPRPNLKTIEFLAQKSKDDESIHIPIDNILSEWNSLFNIDHIRNMGVKVIANNCTLSNLNILNILKSQSNYFWYDLMIIKSDHNIERIEAANGKVILFNIKNIIIFDNT